MFSVVQWFSNFFADGNLKLHNIIAGISDTEMDGSSSKLNKAVNEVQFITHTFNVKYGPGAFCIYRISGRM
jgi:hypothetical protein